MTVIHMTLHVVVTRERLGFVRLMAAGPGTRTSHGREVRFRVFRMACVNVPVALLPPFKLLVADIATDWEKVRFHVLTV